MEFVELYTSSPETIHLPILCKYSLDLDFDELLQEACENLWIYQESFYGIRLFDQNDKYNYKYIFKGENLGKYSPKRKTFLIINNYPDIKEPVYIENPTEENLRDDENIKLIKENERTYKEKEAFDCAKKSAEKGNSLGMYYLGRYYMFGYGVDEEYYQGAKYFIRSAKMCDPMGIAGLWYMYSYGVMQEFGMKKGNELFVKAIDKDPNCSEAIFRRGIDKRFGRSCEIDYPGAIEVFYRSMENGLISGYYQIGDILREYNNGDKNLMYRCFKHGADCGFSLCFEAVVLYVDSTSLPKPDACSICVRYTKKGERLGYSDSIVYYSALLLDGNLVKMDIAQGISLFHRHVHSDKANMLYYLAEVLSEELAQYMPQEYLVQYYYKRAADLLEFKSINTLTEKCFEKDTIFTRDPNFFIHIQRKKKRN